MKVACRSNPSARKVAVCALCLNVTVLIALSAPASAPNDKRIASGQPRIIRCLETSLGGKLKALPDRFYGYDESESSLRKVRQLVLGEFTGNSFSLWT